MERDVASGELTADGLTALGKGARRRAADVAVHFDTLGPDPIDGFDLAVLDPSGGVLGAERFVFAEPHVPALSEIMSDIEDRLGDLDLVVEMPTFRLGDDGHALAAHVHARARGEGLHGE
ncbi:hypothetical protein [Frondihabitans australicus]|uniref:Uncharacterized protein n=1 Tax=Frondihabitans australicus TaxID=386892 RepID=A0A495IIL5_9MICO|nr:hypothetical protein [Frondihabitans australicus]RKR74955.1 hypothetical protein C8E83_2089 [Frondihabitans australicus]